MIRALLALAGYVPIAVLDRETVALDANAGLQRYVEDLLADNDKLRRRLWRFTDRARDGATGRFEKR